MKTKSQLVNRNAKCNTNTRVCISLFMCVCVCACECKEIYWKRSPKASERKYGWAWLKLELQEMRSSLLHFIYGFAWRPRKPKTELELNWENLQAACFVCLTKLPASMQKGRCYRAAVGHTNNWKTLIKRNRVWKQTNVMPACMVRFEAHCLYKCWASEWLKQMSAPIKVF